jgi:hypothetical protein
MAQKFSKNFYQSKLWLDCRESYIASVYGLCERCTIKGCTTPGLILHHKILLTPSNINNPDITLNHKHLEYLCLECHNISHGAKDIRVIRDGLMFDVEGNVVPIAPP